MKVGPLFGMHIIKNNALHMSNNYLLKKEGFHIIFIFPFSSCPGFYSKFLEVTEKKKDERVGLKTLFTLVFLLLSKNISIEKIINNL